MQQTIQDSGGEDRVAVDSAHSPMGEVGRHTGAAALVASVCNAVMASKIGATGWAPMKLSADERIELQRQANARNGRADSARHARLILLLAEGLTWAQIRAKLDCADSYISCWSRRFEKERLAGLCSRHTGRTRYKVTDRLEARILAWTTARKPADGSTQWSSRKLARELGADVSHMTVTRIWAKHGLKPQRLEGGMSSKGLDFETRAADVIGLYLNSPQHAAVFCIDAKTAIQAHDRKDPLLPLSPGGAKRRGVHSYRHGSLSL
ncbi:MAG: helix-turn-helix domain-containing protein, partial [Burkholderiaceae bacterium]